MTLAEVLHALVDKVHGWGSVPEMHDAIDQHFGDAPTAAPSSKKPADKPSAEGG